MYTSMHSPVSSTLVTVWAFKRNCFLIKVSMSTSVRVHSYSLAGDTKLTGFRGALQSPARLQLQRFKGLQLPLHFSEKNLIKVSMSTSVRVLSYSLVGNTKINRRRGALQIPAHHNPEHSKGFNCNYTFWIGTPISFPFGARRDGGVIHELSSPVASQPDRLTSAVHPCRFCHNTRPFVPAGPAQVIPP